MASIGQIKDGIYVKAILRVQSTFEARITVIHSHRTTTIMSIYKVMLDCLKLPLTKQAINYISTYPMQSRREVPSLQASSTFSTHLGPITRLGHKLKSSMHLKSFSIRLQSTRLTESDLISRCRSSIIQTKRMVQLREHLCLCFLILKPSVKSTKKRKKLLVPFSSLFTWRSCRDEVLSLTRCFSHQSLRWLEVIIDGYTRDLWLCHHAPKISSFKFSKEFYLLTRKPLSISKSGKLTTKTSLKSLRTKNAQITLQRQATTEKPIFCRSTRQLTLSPLTTEKQLWSKSTETWLCLESWCLWLPHWQALFAISSVPLSKRHFQRLLTSMIKERRKMRRLSKAQISRHPSRSWSISNSKWTNRTPTRSRKTE